MSFDQLNLISPIRDALTSEGYTIPTEIQRQAIPPLLDRELARLRADRHGKDCGICDPYPSASYGRSGISKGTRK